MSTSLSATRTSIIPSDAGSTEEPPKRSEFVAHYLAQLSAEVVRPLPHCTTTVPTIPGWIAQWYVNVPAV